jgi:hypothetical protein
MAQIFNDFTNMSAGRVDLSNAADIPLKYSGSGGGGGLFEPAHPNQASIYAGDFSQRSLRIQHSENDLSSVYFSARNLDLVQDAIRYKVFRETNGQYKIGRQSDSELRVIMRSMYLQYAKNLPTNCAQQVQELNGMVIDWAVPEILSNLKQYEAYKRDVSQMPTLMDRAPLMTSKGTKTLERKSFL